MCFGDSYLVTVTSSGHIDHFLNSGFVLIIYQATVTFSLYNIVNNL